MYYFNRTVQFSVLVLLVVIGVEGKFYNVSTDFSKCTIHYSKSAINYDTFFEIADHIPLPSIPTSNTTDNTTTEPDNLILIDFHFSVLAASDAHILLSPSTKLERTDPVYEIVLGAGGNSFSDIRRMQKNAVMQSVRIKDLLSVVDIMSFWIHVMKDGTIEVGKEGEEVPFIFWKDTDPIPIKYFSLCTWSGVWAKWYFDCPREDNATHSKAIERPVTDLERLRKNLLAKYSPFVRPVYNVSEITIVNMEITTHFIALNEHQSTMSVKGALKLTWQDEKLKWTPGDYGNIELLQIFHGEIWKPDLTLYNAVSPDFKEIFSSTMLVVNSTGWVEWTPPMHSDTWCEASELGEWPSDVHTCSLVFGFMRDIAKTQLTFVNKETNYMKHYSNGWKVLEMYAEGNFATENLTTINFNAPAELALNFKVKRSSEMHNLAYFTPFFFIAITTLSTFWVSPFGYLKITLSCVQLLLTVLILLGLAIAIPGHPFKIPYFVYLYSSTMITGITNLIIAIVVINLARVEKKYSVPHILKVLITSPAVQYIFCLPNSKMEEEYGKLTDSITANNSNQDIWILLGATIDRIAFFIYTILFSVAIYCKH